MCPKWIFDSLVLSFCRKEGGLRSSGFPIPEDLKREDSFPKLHHLTKQHQRRQSQSNKHKQTKVTVIKLSLSYRACHPPISAASIPGQLFHNHPGQLAHGAPRHPLDRSSSIIIYRYIKSLAGFIFHGCLLTTQHQVR